MLGMGKSPITLVYYLTRNMPVKSIFYLVIYFIVVVHKKLAYILSSYSSYVEVSLDDIRLLSIVLNY